MMAWISWSRKLWKLLHMGLPLFFLLIFFLQSMCGPSLLQWGNHLTLHFTPWHILKCHAFMMKNSLLKAMGRGRLCIKTRRWKIEWRKPSRGYFQFLYKLKRGKNLLFLLLDWRILQTCHIWMRGGAQNQINGGLVMGQIVCICKYFKLTFYHKWHALHQLKGIGAPMVSFILWSEIGWDHIRIRILYMCIQTYTLCLVGMTNIQVCLINNGTWMHKTET